MHNFKKVCLSVVSVLLIFFFISTFLISGYLNSETCFYQDSQVLDTVSGKLDFIVTGSSNALMAFDTSVLDSELKCYSYSISGTLMTLRAKKFLLQHEVQRNPVKTVVMEVSYETLSRNESKECAEGDAISLTKLSNTYDRVAFISQCIRFEDYLNLYSQLFPPTIEYWLSQISGKNISAVDYDVKGFHGYELNNVKIPERSVNDTHNKKQLNTNYLQVNVECLTSMIQYCQSQGIRVILTTIPRSDAELWKFNGHDIFYEYMKDFSKRQHCEYYDMNLLVQRYDLFKDDNSYHDESHMSVNAAPAFTKAFCDIIQKAETEDVSQYFYSSYEEMKADSPYMQYLK